jgi:hypothetical protein
VREVEIVVKDDAIAFLGECNLAVLRQREIGQIVHEITKKAATSD